MFSKVLVANRGEIAVRVIRALRELDITSVAIFSEADREALHVRLADEAYGVGPAASALSYLVIDKIIEVAKQSGAQAIHPGYGFLSENAAFARRCQDEGIVFIGPPDSAITSMGQKTQARQIMAAAGVPLVPGTKEPVVDAASALVFAEQAGFPVLIKAAAGGGGKGMRRVDDPDDFVAAFDGARREALSAFGDDTVYIEKYVVHPKHVEFQVLADTYGNVVHVFERECSVQRRHQKIIEETPSPVLLEDTRRRMGEVAVTAARTVGYVGAGTVEFLLDIDQNFYFLEMNTRLQVEHPITEMISGLDLVRWQIKIAAGHKLTLTQEDIKQRGHALECRIYAEDPNRNFMPSPGHITYMHEPTGPGVRVDSGVYSGATVPVHYDPMISKLTVWGEDREHAIGRMRRALREYVIAGIITNLAYHEELLSHPDFLDGSYNTEFVPDLMRDRQAPRPQHVEEAELAAVLAAYSEEQSVVSKGPVVSAQQKEGMDPWKLLGRVEGQRRSF